MTNQYANPDLTVRDQVEQSRAYIAALLDYYQNGGERPTKPDLFDPGASQVITQLENFDAAQLALAQSEQQRLADVISMWDGQPQPMPVPPAPVAPE